MANEWSVYRSYPTEKHNMRKRECVREQLHDVTSYANLINRNTHHVLLRKQEDYQAHREGQKWELKPSIQLKTIVVKKKKNKPCLLYEYDDKHFYSKYNLQ